MFQNYSNIPNQFPLQETFRNVHCPLLWDTMRCNVGIIKCCYHSFKPYERRAPHAVLVGGMNMVHKHLSTGVVFPKKQLEKK